jgi:hypothetical protein
MDFSRLVKLVVVVVIVFAIWKYVIPWAKDEMGGFAGKSSSATATGDSGCVNSAERASSAWGAGLGRFVNPPYDLDAWSNFKGDVDGKISQAESDCSCAEESCTKVKSAMSDLRTLVSDFDHAIRTGSSPGSDAVQRQEQIDRQIDDARELLRAGK